MNYFMKFWYYLKWGFNYVIRKKRIPLSGSIILTDKCNLDCRHCNVSNLGYRPLDLGAVKRDLDTLYNTGARILVITGGEPFLWRDRNGHGLWHVVEYAKTLGFFRTVICTNGTLELDSQADYLWVSIDGVPAEHDDLRGAGTFDKIMANILKSKHPRIYINYTISASNQLCFEKATEDILHYKKIRGILFHFFTPYVGLEDSPLTLSGEQRRAAIEKILTIKRKHPLRVSNTYAGLKALLNDEWKRPTWASVVINDGELTACCCRRTIRDANVCVNCGCTPAVETWVLQTLKPSALIENMRFL